MGNDQQSFKNEVLQLSNVISASYSTGIPGMNEGGTFTYKKGESKDNVILVSYIFVDEDFIGTYNIPVTQSFNTLKEQKFKMGDIVANKTTIREFNIKDPLKEQLIISGRELNFNITNIMHDFHFESMFNKVRPLVIVGWDIPKNFISIKLGNQNNAATIEKIEDEFIELSNSQSMEYFFIDQHFNSMYRDERLTKSLFTVFSFIVVFIAMFGLLGLTSFTLQKRIKEIGIRKTLGANKKQIYFLLSNRLIVLVVISNIVAWPLSYVFIDKWLQNFAYRVEIDIWPFIITAILSFAMVFLTIAFITSKTIKANPIDALRYE